jgi:Ig-like domain from next to BRCA1 gene
VIHFRHNTIDDFSLFMFRLPERRNRSGRGSCRGPYYRSHSRIRCPNRLEQPHPKSLSWLTYLRGLNADSLFPPTSGSQQDEAYNSTSKTHLPFSPFFHNEAHSAPLQLAFVNTTSDLALNLKCPIEEIRSSQCPLPVDIESLSLTLTPAAPLAKPMVCFIRDVTFPDCAAVQPRSTFLKTWRVRNVGTTRWPDGLTLCSEAAGTAKLEPSIAVAQTHPGQGKRSRARLELSGLGSSQILSSRSALIEERMLVLT